MNNYFKQIFNYASTQHQQGDFKGAQAAYHQILKDFPNHPDVLHLMGLTYAQQNLFGEAISWITKAIMVKSDIPAFHNNLAETYVRMGDLENAMQHYQGAIKCDPKFAQGYFGQANTLKKQGKYAEAMSMYQKALEVNPKYFQALYNMGNLEQEVGNYKSAMINYEKCLKINPRHEMAHNNMGIMLQHWDRVDDAISHYRQAIEINPKFTKAYLNLAKLYESQAKIDEAKACYTSVSKLKPSDRLIQFTIQTLSPVVFDSNEAIDTYHASIHSALDQYKSLPFNPTELEETSVNIFSDMIYHGRSTITLRKKYVSKFLHAIPTIPVRQPNAKPHIGFVVTDGHEGVFLKCMRGLINMIDLHKFDVTIVCSLPNGKRILAGAIENATVKYLEIPKRIDHASQQMLDAKFDVLYYWEIGTDTLNFFLPYLRLASVQCTSWGWPTTSGIPNVDYFISAKHLESEGGDSYYSEQLIRLNRIPVYYYAPPVPKKLKPLAEYGLSTDQHLYLCAQNVKKVHPDFDNLVRGILDMDTNAVVLFIEDKKENISHLLRERLRRTIPQHQERIKFLSRMPEEDYLGLLKQVNVALDTLHYGGGANTCYDAFVCGTPVITLPGEMHSSRYAYAAYHQMEFTECISVDAHDYVTKAVTIATQPDLRAAYSKIILERAALVLEDIESVHELENFLLSVLEK